MKKKVTALFALTSSMVFFWGCSLGVLIDAFIAAAPITLLMEFLLDNDSILDVFGDSAPGLLG